MKRYVCIGKCNIKKETFNSNINEYRLIEAWRNIAVYTLGDQTMSSGNAV